MPTSILGLSLFEDPNWIFRQDVRWVLTGLYMGVLLLISIYGLHRYWLVLMYYRTRRNLPRRHAHFQDLPRVTVQLPMFNEAQVAQRVIDAACQLDYPKDKLQIQVVDDSTDHSAQVARQRVDYWAARGMDIQYLHRTNREGYKAGALENAMKSATGQFIAIFDADFIPNPRFLKQTIHYFTDARVGMVQTRWGHLNREESMLTRAQAIFLDGHFVIEHTSRNRGGRFINFNGTAGIWRTATIEDAGGWEHDTLTEDTDLSYRAQVKGWKFLFLPKVVSPAELPPEIGAFKSQQHRWTKGLIQTALKLLPMLLKSRIPWRCKLEAAFHLTAPMVYLYVTLMALLFYPAIRVNMQVADGGTLASVLLGVSLFAMGTFSAGLFYVASQAVQHRSIWQTMLQLPVLMAVGVGIAVNNTRAVIEALFGHESPFVRTPKYAAGDHAEEDTTEVRPRRRKSPWRGLALKLTVSAVEITMGLYMLCCVYASFTRIDLNGNTQHTFISAPFLMIFACGYLYVGLATLWQQAMAARPVRLPAPAAS